MKLDIVGGSYRGKYTSMNVQRTINYYIHKQLIETEDDKYPTSLQPTPGLTAFANTTKTFLRCIFVARTLNKERCFVVADNYLYEIKEDGTATSLGQMSAITNDYSPCYMEVNSENQVMVCHSSASYIFDMDDDSLNQITDSDFTALTPTSLTYNQGYFIVTSGGRVYYSALLNGLSWTATDVFTPSSSADKTICAITWRDDVHCFGSNSIETYINDGISPFIKQGRDTIDVGLVSVDTLCKFHEGIIFLGKTSKGQTRVFYYNGQQCVAISSSNIDWQLDNPTNVSGVTWDNLHTYTWDQWIDQWGITVDNSYAEIQYSKDGHIFYYLTIPTLHTTYVFDIIGKEWIERQSYNSSVQRDLEFRGKQMVNFKGMNLFTDIQSGKIMKEDFSGMTEDSQPITRTRISQIVHNEKKNMSMYSFELDTTTGVGLSSTPATEANIALYFSRDGGNTYSSPINLSTGASTAYTKRPRVHKLGTARDWTFKLVQSDTADLSINSAIVHGIVDEY